MAAVEPMTCEAHVAHRRELAKASQALRLAAPSAIAPYVMWSDWPYD